MSEVGCFIHLHTHIFFIFSIADHNESFQYSFFPFSSYYLIDYSYNMTSNHITIFLIVALDNIIINRNKPKVTSGLTDI